MNYDVPGTQQAEKDICSYHIYVKEPSLATAQEVESLIREIHNPWTVDYIWQVESFSIAINDDYSLGGSTRFGDCIEDEWLIVWILTELSKRRSDVYVRITDTDGEFLLIESAMHLPRWLNPDSALNRAWIREGNFVIIEPTQADITARNCPYLSLEDALDHLRKNGNILHDDQIQQDALARIRKYPEQSNKEMHRVNCTVPRVVATLLHQDPSLIAPTCIELCNRDQLQIEQQNKSPSRLRLAEAADQVTISVKLTRTLYAQIKGLKFTVPAWYNEKFVPVSQLPAIDTGSKVTCGLDLLLMSSEAAIEAITRARSNPATDAEIAKWDTRIDSDAYLDVNFEELEKVMAGNSVDTSKEDVESEDTIRKMIQQMQKFMNTDSTFEGAEFSGDEHDEDDEEEEEEFDEEDVEDGFNDEDMDFMNFLRSTVSDKSALEALRNAREDKDVEEEKEESEPDSVGDLREYMSSMDAELSSHGLTSTSTRQDNDKDENLDGEDLDDDLKIDFTLAKNMLESMKSEGGMSGPAAGLLSRMGISVPRNDEDEDEDGLEEELD
ncbi:putative Regulatory factor Sgt1 [Taphrina deformans PYCC 5710]|uniref:Regulatory factor Sgt1 n=1 Tax=Taphrina deformans (strain PYCC 5710 / ATCC 11124 / CBS 356.35 / IMI 108563 / JCM 9778 / NBRC 8474) TaxID=1097556 RepID=R4X6J3_TAPDE|nr:putative Regulatory factor Sgt1 [Taphrina deformans PYCC 5710]|eukprot:CCG80740.1 putative Regulatory factor Sgt1 [Taphrina deformans PYCC 5710]